MSLKCSLNFRQVALRRVNVLNVSFRTNLHLIEFAFDVEFSFTLSFTRLYKPPSMVSFSWNNKTIDHQNCFLHGSIAVYHWILIFSSVIDFAFCQLS